jgi:hypothetical protein
MQFISFDSFLFLGGLLQAFQTAASVIEGVGFVSSAAAIIGAVLSGMGERSLGGMKISLVLAIIAGCAWLITGVFFAAGGWNTNIAPGALN